MLTDSKQVRVLVDSELAQTQVHSEIWMNCRVWLERQFRINLSCRGSGKTTILSRLVELPMMSTCAWKNPNWTLKLAFWDNKFQLLYRSLVEFLWEPHLPKQYRWIIGQATRIPSLWRPARPKFQFRTPKTRIPKASKASIRVWSSRHSSSINSWKVATQSRPTCWLIRTMRATRTIRGQIWTEVAKLCQIMSDPRMKWAALLHPQICPLAK